MATHAFRDRFIDCLSPLQWLLPLVDTGETRKRTIYYLLMASILFFVARISADIYYFYLYLLPLIKFALSNNQEDFPGVNKGVTRIDAIGYVSDKLSSSLCHVFTYWLLLASGRQTIFMFCSSLERLNQSSDQLDLSRVRKRTAMAVVWTLVVVIVESYISIYWFLKDNNKTSLTCLQMYTLIFPRLNICVIHVSAWLYATCTATIVIYYRHVNEKLQHLSKTDDVLSVDRLLTTIQDLRRLHQSSELLHARFGHVLFVNYASLVICVTQAIYYNIRYSQVTNLSLWLNAFYLFELISRYFLMCHSADSLRNARSKSVAALRQCKAHETLRKATALDRLKLTLYMIEVSHGVKEVQLLGMVNLSKRTLLKSMETAVTFFIIIYQFQLVESYAITT